ncbi:MAG: ammonium transporter, partial [Microcystis sp.]
MKRIARKSGELVGLLPKINPVWLACVPLSAIIFVVWNTAVQAQDAKPLTPEDVQNALNTIWVLIAAILVIFMNAGFAMLETGFCRQKNAVNVLAKNLIVFALSTISFWAIGFSLMFGSVSNEFFGTGG